MAKRNSNMSVKRAFAIIIDGGTEGQREQAITRIARAMQSELKFIEKARGMYSWSDLYNFVADIDVEEGLSYFVEQFADMANNYEFCY